MAERVFVPGQDDEAVLDLRARVWGKDHPHTSAAYYEWLFRKTPSGTGSGIVAIHEDKIVGFAGLCNRSAAMGSQDLRFCHGLDFMVDPAVSGTLSSRIAVKVMNKHVDLARDLGFDLSINYPNQRSRRMLVSKRGAFSEVLRPDLMICPLTSFAASSESQSSSLKRAVMTLGGRSLAAAGAVRRALRRSSGARIERIEQFDAAFDAFWAELRRDGKLRLCRDRENLHWRFSCHPLHRYTIWTAVQNGRFAGYLVTAGREILGMQAAIIADLCFLPGAEDAASDLLAEAVRAAAAQGSMLLAAQAVTNSPFRLALLRAGFVAVPHALNPKPFMMVTHIHTELAKPALQGGNWSFAWSDMDVV